MPATLERTPKVKKPREEGDYLVWDDVPVWKEHISPDEDRIPFDANALERVAQRCNDRIEETGDFTPITLRHTSDDRDVDPPVIGMAGPYKVGRYGRKNPKTTIFAKLRIHKRYAAIAGRYPRLSVEYWAKKSDPTNGFFDPISLLGAETPELDLGQWNLDNDDLKRYHRQKHNGMICRRYEMSSPAGGNTFAPGLVGDDEDQPTQYAKQGAFAPEDIAQIVAAFKPVIQSMFDDQESRVMAALDEKLQAAGLGDDDLSDEAPLGLDDELEPELEPGLGDELGDEPPAELGDEPALDPETDLETDEEPEPMAATPAKPGAAAPTAPAADATGNDKEKATRYQKERDEYRAKYQKLVTENRELADAKRNLEVEVETLRGDSAKLNRYQRLSALEREGYVLDVDAENAETAEMTEDQFERHTERIKRNYQRIPMGGVPAEQPRPLKEGIGATEDPDFRIKYSKRAGELYKAAESRNEAPNWNACVEQAKRELASTGG